MLLSRDPPDPELGPLGRQIQQGGDPRTPGFDHMARDKDGREPTPCVECSLDLTIQVEPWLWPGRIILRNRADRQGNRGADPAVPVRATVQSHAL